MLNALLRTVSTAYEAGRHRDLLAALWEQERWFDSPHQLAAAEIVRDRLDRAGLADVRLAPFAADGRTRYQDWTTRMAWECPAARLSIAGSGDVLADRRACPASVAAWSAPLGAESAPVRAGVVDGDALDPLRPEDVRGKFVLTAGAARRMKGRQDRTRPTRTSERPSMACCVTATSWKVTAFSICP